MSSLLQRLYVEIGLQALTSSSRDVKLLCLQRLVRMFAYGASTLVLALYLSSVGVSDEKIGFFMTLTLWGDVIISLILTLVADGIGRRRMLALGSILMSASGVIFAISSNYWVLVAASVFGVISPSGNEIGPFKAIEESTISQLVPSADRSSIIAWYTLIGTFGTAIGTVIGGWLVQVLQSYQRSAVSSYRVVFWIYAVVGVVKLILSLMLSPSCEHQKKKTQPERVPAYSEDQPFLADEEEAPVSPVKPQSKAVSWLKSLLPTLSPESQSLVLKLCFLFAMDSMGGGLVPSSWMIYFFNRKFGLAEGSLGSLFFVTNILSSASSLVASSIARRIGLVKTMVVTHVPASIALVMIPFPSNVIIAMALLIFRSSTSSMDQAPRQAFLAAAVLPAERTAVMGIVNVVKTLSQSVGPVLTGLFAGWGKFWIAFVAAGSLKLSYDMLMLKMFLGYRTQEERAEEALAMTPIKDDEDYDDDASNHSGSRVDHT